MMTEHLFLEYGAEVFVAGGFKICIRQVQENAELLMVFDDEQIDDLVAALRQTQEQARNDRLSDMKHGEGE